MRAMLWLISSLLLVVGCTTEHHRAVEREVSIEYLGSLVRYEAVVLIDDIAIRGRIVANDKMGELTNAVVISDDTAGVELKVESSYVDPLLPLYAEATVHCSGLYLAREGTKLVIGNKPTTEYIVDRLSESDISIYITVDTLPTAPPTPTKRTIGEVSTSDMLRYVRIDDVAFVEEGEVWLDCDSLGMPLNSLRHITDALDTLTVVVNDATIYGTEYLPTGRVNCFGIIDSNEGEPALRIINKQTIKQ